jgi:F-type H+-transporting ATPase subunit b
MQGSLPQFDISFFPSQIFWTLVSFGLLYIIVHFGLAPRLGSLIQQRLGQIDQDLALAAELTEQAEMLRKECAKEMEQARLEASRVVERSNKELSKKLANHEHMLSASLGQQLHEAEQQIEQAKQAAVLELQQVTQRVATDLMHKGFGITLDNKAFEKSLSVNLPQ